MTVLVGILCEDGVVIGSDSAATYGPAPMLRTIEYDALKLEILWGNVITAFTGAVGLGQRFNEQLETLFNTLQTAYNPVAHQQQLIMTPMGPMMAPMQRALSAIQPGRIPLDTLPSVEVGTLISETVIANFRRTHSAQQLNTPQGWGLGALVAFIGNDAPQLLEFDGVQFHPELKGLPDPARGGRSRVWRSASMGSGQMLADSFLAHAYRLLFGESVPTVDRAKLVASWTLAHVIRYNTGGVGGDQQLAVLEKKDGGWQAAYVDAKGEISQQIDELEQYIAGFRRQTVQRLDAPEVLDARVAVQAEILSPEVPDTVDSTQGETPT